MNLKVKGSHCGNARFDSNKIKSCMVADAGGVTIRLVDENNLDWWLEIDITREQLESILEHVTA